MLCIAKSFIYPGSLWGAMASAALVAGVSPVSILEEVTGLEFVHQFDTLFPHITNTDHQQDSVQCGVLGLSK